MAEKFLLFKIGQTRFAIGIKDIVKVARLDSSQLIHTGKKNARFIHDEREVPIINFGKSLKKADYGKKSLLFAILISTENKSGNSELAGIIISGAIKIVNIEYFQNSFDLISGYANYIDRIGLESDRPVIIISKKSIF